MIQNEWNSFFPEGFRIPRRRSSSAPLRVQKGHCFVRIDCRVVRKSQSAPGAAVACKVDDAPFSPSKETKHWTDASEADRIVVVFLSSDTCQWRSCLFLSSSSDPPCPSIFFWIGRRHTVIRGPRPLELVVDPPAPLAMQASSSSWILGDRKRPWSPQCFQGNTVILFLWKILGQLVSTGCYFNVLYGKYPGSEHADISGRMHSLHELSASSIRLPPTLHHRPGYCCHLHTKPSI